MGTFPPAPNESASLEIVARIQDGDEEAWSELYRRYHDQLLLTVRMRIGPKLRGLLQSEDVFQSVALDAFTALERFEYRGPGSLERFLKRMVVNKIRDRADTFSAQKRDGGVPLTDTVLGALSEPDGASAGYHEAETYEKLERALQALPDEMREVVLLRKVDGLASKEVAELTKKSDDAVRQLYSRAMARLTTLMTG